MSGYLDAEAVVRQVNAGTAPATWQVLRPKTSYFYVGVIGYLALSVGAVVVAGYLLLSGTVIGIGVRNVTAEGVLNFWFAVDMLVLAALLIGGIIAAFKRVYSLSTADAQMLVLLPEGFLQKTGDKAKQVRSVVYADIAAMKPVVVSGNLQLELQTHDGRSARMQVDERFGAPKALIEQIQVAYAAAVTAGANIHRG